MIRVATYEDISLCRGSEAAIRIVASCRAYGLQTSFLHFYTDGIGAEMSLMDGVAVLHAPRGLDEEWISFLTMHPDIRTVRTDAPCGRTLAERWDVNAKMGDFMSYRGGIVDAEAVDRPRCEELYAFLADYFALPPFDSWYVDVSHRLRHGQCHIASVIRDGCVVCNAMSVAETESDILLGAVATAPSMRRQGLAARCIRALIAQLSDKQVHISPVDDRARQVYEAIGFSVSGSWAEVPRQ